MMQSCRKCFQTFEIGEDDVRFLDKLSPTIGNTKLELPPPTVCPDCRMQRRLSFRNERFLYSRKCDKCGSDIISIYHPESPLTVYCPTCWWGDEWDGLHYGREIDFNRPVFEQMMEIKKEIPHLSLVSSPEALEYNCKYVSFAGNNKNCYLIFDSDYNEDSYFSNVLKHSKNCIDCSYVNNSELCYQCIDGDNCYNLQYSENCTNCRDSKFLKNCIGCSDCFMCCNLTRKQYYFKNKPLTKEEYIRKLQEYNMYQTSVVQKLHTEYRTFILKFPRKYGYITNAENSTGDVMYDTKNAFQSYNIADCEDVRYCDSLYAARDCMDVSSFGEKIEMVYESGTAGLNSYGLRFCFACVFNCSDILYGIECRQSKNLFACVGLKRQQYCILNKPYTKEEYESLVLRLMEHMKQTGDWGEYFSSEMSAFGYNETVAQEYFPLKKEDALQQGFYWSDYEAPKREMQKVIPASKLPDDTSRIPDDILNWALLCEVTGKPFVLTKQELSFYRDNHIPIPHKHPDQRHKERMALRNPRKLWKRTCMNCQKEIETTYSPERLEIVYCEECYLKEVY